MLYPDNKASAFSIFKMYGAFGHTLHLAYGSYLCMRTKLIIVLSFYTIGMILFSLVYYDYKKKSGDLGGNRLHTSNNVTKYMSIEESKGGS